MVSKPEGETMAMGFQSEERVCSVSTALDMIRAETGLTTGGLKLSMIKFNRYFKKYLIFYK